MKKVRLFEEFTGEAKVNKGKVHKAAKTASYPATLVVVDGKEVVHQELVDTPMAVPAAISVLKDKYPTCKIHVESKDGEVVFVQEDTESISTESESLTEASLMNSYYFTSPSEFGEFASDAPGKGETKYVVMSTNKADFNGQIIKLEDSIRMGSATSKKVIGVYDDEQSAKDAYNTAMKKPVGTMVSFTMGSVVGETKFRSQYTEIEGYLAKVKVK